MKSSTEDLEREMMTLAMDARALLEATAGLAEEKISETRRRLAMALENAKAHYGDEQEQAVVEGKMLDQFVREHPYKTMGIVFVFGTVIGSMLARR